jgi:hypothetical protein
MKNGDYRLQHFRGAIQIQKVDCLSTKPNLTMLHHYIFPFVRRNLIVHIHNFTFAASGSSIEEFLCLGWIIEKAVRDMKYRKFIGVQQMTRDWKGTTGPVNLRNLRFRPACQQFNEELFHKRIHGMALVFVNKYAMKLYGSTDDLLDAVRSWYADGL